jgi:hypothetical protein
MDGWMEVPQCFLSVGLYSKTSKLILPLTSVVEEFKTGNARLIMTLTNSNDPKVPDAREYIQSGHKWKTIQAVSEAESRFCYKDIVDTVCKGQELGCKTKKEMEGETRESGQLVQQEIRTKEEKARYVQAVEMGNQRN